MTKAYAFLVALVFVVLPCSHARTSFKTLKSDNGDIIDCVDIYKQPSFDHPLLRNHTIQMTPNSLSVIQPSSVSELPLMEKGSCPEGTIPIRRVHKGYKQGLGRKGQLSTHGRMLAGKPIPEGAGISHKSTAGNLRGVSGELNVWSVNVEPNDFSWTSVRVSSGNSPGGFIEAGYMANPKLYGDNKPHFFASWTADSGKTTGCFDLVCPGFVQVSNEIAIGSTLTPISSYDGIQHSIVISISKSADKWWLTKNNVSVGYWPLSIVPDLDVMKEAVWAGWVVSNRNDGKHTTTEMGSGHFAFEGAKRAAYINQALVLSQIEYQIPNPIVPFTDKGGCYDVRIMDGIYKKVLPVYYGGPGGGPGNFNCT